MPVSELDIANSLYWLLGYGPSDERGRQLTDRLNLRSTRDQASLRHALMSSEDFGRSVAEQRKPLTNPPLQLDRPRLILIHVPKCGGTTLHAILTRHFVPASICPERFNGLRAYRLDELAGFDLFCGHFDLESCRALYGRNTSLVTMLREPRDRLVSLYYFLKIHRLGVVPAIDTMVQLARTLPAEEFFRHPLIRRHASVRNGMAAPFIGPLAALRWEAVEDQLSETDLVVTDPQAAGERAFEAVASLTGFGLLEEFTGSIEMLSATLGLRLEALPPQQVTDELRSLETLSYAERPELTPALLDVIDELTQADRVLYDKAKALFEARLTRFRAGATGGKDTVATPAFGLAHVIPLDRFHALEARREGSRIVASGVEGVLAAGPYMALQHGRYRLTCHFVDQDVTAHGTPAFTLNVWHNRGQGACEQVRWTAPSPCVLDFTLTFDVSDIEFVINVGPESRLELLAISLQQGIEDEADRGSSSS